MKIGELAEITGTTVETIRFYERENLMRSASRAGNNYRVYSQEHVNQLAFIRRCRSLDMTLDEVRTLLLLRGGTAEDCSDVNALLDRHIEHVMNRIHELNALVAELHGISANCTSSRPLEKCGILSELESSSSVSNASTHPRRHIHGTH